MGVCGCPERQLGKSRYIVSHAVVVMLTYKCVHIVNYRSSSHSYKSRDCFSPEDRVTLLSISFPET